MSGRIPDSIKIDHCRLKKRLKKLTLKSFPDLHIGDCVPFYFCPCTAMLHGGAVERGNPAMIEWKSGDIFEDGAEALVNTVNCVGVMGRGIALQFKKRYPENFARYEKACRKKEANGKLNWPSTNLRQTNWISSIA